MLPIMMPFMFRSRQCCGAILSRSAAIDKLIYPTTAVQLLLNLRQMNSESHSISGLCHGRPPQTFIHITKVILLSTKISVQGPLNTELNSPLCKSLNMIVIVFKLASSVPPKEKDLPDIFEVSRYPMGPSSSLIQVLRDFENEAATGMSFDLLPNQVEIYSSGEKITQITTGGSSGPKWNC